MISKVTPRTRNSETDSRFVAPDQYTDAVNIRVGHSFSESGTGDATPSSNVGVVKPVKGTTEFSTTFTSTVVGKIVDSESGDVYVAAINPDATQNGVYRLTKNGEFTPVVKSSYFAWSDASRVDMTITYKSSPSGTSPIIYLTDNASDPYKVDVQFHENNTELEGRRMFDAITVCTPTPQDVVQTVFGYQQGGSLSRTSNFRNIPGMQFAYQNIHETGEVSPLSAYSSLAVPPGYLTQGASNVESVDNYNSLQILVPSQETSVEKVRLLVRFGEEGSWFVMGEYDNDPSGVEVYFQNDEILPVLPSQQAERQFENVPQLAATNEIVEDRLFYGNYVEGYDNHPVQASLAVSYQERPDDFVSLDIEVDSYMMGLKRDGNTAGADNRVAGIKLKLTNPDGINIPADSTVSFDISFAPDKNFHIYEAQNSFHPNNELFEYNDATDYSGNFADRFKPSTTASEDAWERGVYGYGPMTVAVGNAAGQRVGVSDDIITGNSAKWRVKAGPNEGEELEVVYGSSPANPLIFKGGDISFSCKFRTTTDLSQENILTLIRQVMDNDPTPMIINTGVDNVTYVVPVAELISSQATSSYSYNLGINNRQVIPRTSNLTDLICHVGRKDIISSNNPPSIAPSGLNPVGYFVVDSATLDFKLRDITSVELVGAAAQSNEVFFALDIKRVADYSLKTCVPVFKVAGSTAINAPLGGGSFTLDEGGNFQDDDTGTRVATLDTDLFPLSKHATIQKWVAFEPQSVGQSLTEAVAADLFSTLDGYSSGSAYRQITNFDFLPDDQASDITNYIMKYNGGNRTAAWNNMCWFGELLPANTTVETVISAIGEDFLGGGATTTEVLGDIYIPYDVALERADLAINIYTGQLRDPVLYSNYAASMIDGEGGIGGWKGSLVDTALLWADYVWEKNNDSEWQALTQSPFTETDIRRAMGGYGGKISGSVPASIILYGRLMTEVRVLGDDRGGDSTSNSGKYPEGVPAYGPALLGFSFPFQYLHLGGADTADGVEIVFNRYLGTTNTTLDTLDEQVVASFSQYRDDIYDTGYMTPVAGYLRINPDIDEYDEQPSSLEILSDNTFILSAQSDVEGFKSFKRNSTHDFGVVYYDKFGRSGNVNPIPSIYVAGYSPSEAASSSYGAGNVKIGVNLTSDPPAWAHGYRFVYGGNSSINDFIQYTAGGAFVPVNDEVEQGDEGNIYVSLNYLQENSDVSYSKAFGAVSTIGDKQMYKYKEGDKLRILSYFTSDTLDSRVFPYNYVFDVVDVVTLTSDASNPLHDVSQGDVPRYKTGQFVVLRNNTNAANFSYGAVRGGDNLATTTSHYWNNRAVFEIYSPTSKKDAEERVYREIGKYYKCVEVSGTLKHENAVHILSDGDVWFRRVAMNMPKFKNNRFLNIIKGENASTPRFFDYYVESTRFSDAFAGTDVIGSGKAKLYLPESKRVRRNSSVTFSDVNNPNSQYNKFSTFDATTANFKNIPNEHGPIELIKRDGDSMTVFQNNKISFLPINRSVISDASNSSSLIASSKVVGTQVFVPGRYGSGGNPEAVLYVDGMFYFANRHRREVYRYIPGRGIEVISDLGMKEYFNNLFKNTTATDRIVTAIDHLNDEFLISVTPYTTVNYTTSPTYIAQSTAASQGNDEGTGGLTFVDPTTIEGYTEEEYNTLLSTNEGLQIQIGEFEDLVASLESQLEQAFNDVTTTIVTVNPDLPGGAEGDGDTVIFGTDDTLPDPLEITQEYIAAVTALIRAQESQHSAAKSRYDLTVALNNDIINNANNTGEGGLWDRLGIDPPTDAQLESLNQSVNNQGGNPKTAFYNSQSSLNVVADYPYNSSTETIFFPTATALGGVSETLSGFGLTYVVGWGAGLSASDVTGLFSDQVPQGIDPALNIINNFFPSPIEGTWVDTFNDATLAALTQTINSYVERRAEYINVLNEYVAEQFEIVTEALTDKDVTINDLNTQLDSIKDQYFNDIVAITEAFTRIPYPTRPDLEADVSFVVPSGLTPSETFAYNASTQANYEALQNYRNSQVGAGESLVLDSFGDKFGTALQDNTNTTFTSVIEDVTRLGNERDVLAGQVWELVRGVGDSFAEKAVDSAGNPVSWAFSDPTLQALYESAGSTADILNIISAAGGNSDVIETDDVVGNTEINTDSSSILDTIIVLDQQEALENRFVEDGLDVAVENLMNSIADLVTDTSGTASATETDPVGAAVYDAQQASNVSVNTYLSNGTLAEKLNHLATALTSASPIRNGRTSVKSKLSLLKDAMIALEYILVGNTSKPIPASITTTEQYRNIQGTIEDGSNETGFYATQSSIEDQVAGTGLEGISTSGNVAGGTGGSFVGNAVTGALGEAFDKSTLSSALNDVQYVVNRLTDFQRILGAADHTSFQFGNLGTNIALSDARLGKSGINANKLIALYPTFKSRGGIDKSALYGLQMFLNAITSKVVLDQESYFTQTFYSPIGAELSNAYEVGLGLPTAPIISGLFGAVAGQYVADETESDFGNFTSTPVN